MIISPTNFRANDDEDMVNIVVGSLQPRAAYQTSFEMAHALRMACKSAARYDRVPGSFWIDVDMEDLEDCPLPHRNFRRSKQIENFTNWSVRYQNAEVALVIDDRAEIFGYEDGIKFHQMIRRAGRRAKAWAGDTHKGQKMLANLTDAEEDYRLGLT